MYKHTWYIYVYMFVCVCVCVSLYTYRGFPSVAGLAPSATYPASQRARASVCPLANLHHTRAAAQGSGFREPRV
jgi:hypothetical protein